MSYRGHRELSFNVVLYLCICVSVNMFVFHHFCTLEKLSHYMCISNRHSQHITLEPYLFTRSKVKVIVKCKVVRRCFSWYWPCIWNSKKLACKNSQRENYNIQLFTYQYALQIHFFNMERREICVPAFYVFLCVYIHRTFSFTLFMFWRHTQMYPFYLLGYSSILSVFLWTNVILLSIKSFHSLHWSWVSASKILLKLIFLLSHYRWILKIQLIS